MKWIAAAAVLLFTAAPAAEATERWTSADGHVRLDIPAGWRSVSNAERTDESFRLVLGSETMAARGEQCFIESQERPSILPHDQPLINSSVESIRESDMLLPTDIRHDFATPLIGRVRVLAFDIERDGVRTIERVFNISQREGVIEYVISCKLSPDAADDIAASISFIQSLHIRR